MGTAVGIAESEGVDVAELSLETLQNLSADITDDVFDVLTLEAPLQREIILVALRQNGSGRC